MANEPLFASNTARLENREALDERIALVFVALPRAEAVALLDAADLAFASVNRVSDFTA